jgi:hypothetical protein
MICLALFKAPESNKASLSDRHTGAFVSGDVPACRAGMSSISLIVLRASSYSFGSVVLLSDCTTDVRGGDAGGFTGDDVLAWPCFEQCLDDCLVVVIVGGLSADVGSSLRAAALLEVDRPTYASRVSIFSSSCVSPAD